MEPIPSSSAASCAAAIPIKRKTTQGAAPFYERFR
jgi:hypothetical protein